MHTIASGAASRSATNMPSEDRVDAVTICIVAVTQGYSGWAASRCFLRVQGEVKGGAAAYGAFGPGAPAVAFDDPLDTGQADAGAGELGNRMEPLERLEQLARKGRIEADPVVAHVAADSGLLSGGGAELDGGAVALAGIFRRVFDQVLHHGTDESAIGVHPDTVVEGEADPAAGLAGLQLTGDGG